LHLLGVLPDRKSDIFRVLSDEELIYIERCIQETNDLPVPDVQSDQLSRMCMTLMKEEANRTLKAPDVISALI